MLPLDKAYLPQPLMERWQGMLTNRIFTAGAEKANHRHRRRLRTRGKRPHRRAAEKRDELASLQLHLTPHKPGAMAGYRIGED
jgi:hypothetical protein